MKIFITHFLHKFNITTTQVVSLRNIEISKRYKQIQLNCHKQNLICLGICNKLIALLMYLVHVYSFIAKTILQSVGLCNFLDKFERVVCELRIKTELISRETG